MIRLTRVGKRYGGEVALREVDWEVGQGELGVILGPSGAGKTTLLRLISMEDLPTEGQVQVGSFVSGRISRGQFQTLRQSGYQLVAEGLVPFAEIERTVGRDHA